jgi:hypothetical protein
MNKQAIPTLFVGTFFASFYFGTLIYITLLGSPPEAMADGGRSFDPLF